MPNCYKYNNINYFRNTYTKLLFVPTSKIRISKDDFIIWEYQYKSKSLEFYTICLNYERGWTPRVWIVKPDLTKGFLPHTFKDCGNCLCLFHSRDFVWSSDKDIIQTIICWSCLWIEYYEIYKILGKWVGPEAEHDNIEKVIQEPNSFVIGTNKIKEHPKYLKSYPTRIGGA